MSLSCLLSCLSCLLFDCLPVYQANLYSDPKVDQDNLRFFIEDELDIGKFTITGGLSYELLDIKRSRLNQRMEAGPLSAWIYELLKTDKSEQQKDDGDNNWDGLGGALGIVFHLNPHLNLTGAVAKGVRLPTVEETFFVTPHSGCVIAGNPDLDQEESVDYEIGIKGMYSKLFFTASLYYTKINDMVALACPRPYNQFMENTLFRDNIEEVTIWGSDVSIRYFLLDKWSVYTNVAYTDTEQKGDETMAEPPPPWKGVAGTRFSKNLRSKYFDNFWVDLYSKFAGHIKNRPPAFEGFHLNPPYVSGYATYNLGLGITLKNLWGIGEHRLIFKVDNITDKLHFEGISGSPHGLTNFPQAGRNFIFSWEATF